MVAYLTPRTNDVAASIATSYEESGSSVKLVTDHGDIDFVVTADVTDLTPDIRLVQGRETRVQVPAEILAKKIQYRGFQFTHRDIFDLAMLMEKDPDEVKIAFSFCGKDAIDKTARAIVGHLPSLASDLSQYVNPTRAFVSLIDRAPEIVLEFPGVRDLASRRNKRGH